MALNRIENGGEVAIGSGNRRSLRLVTGGVDRAIFRAAESVMEMPTVLSDPAANTIPGMFFRVSGGKQQFCVRFASGAIQVLATEP